VTIDAIAPTIAIVGAAETAVAMGLRRAQRGRASQLMVYTPMWSADHPNA
jgi:hypothetical protein